VCIEHRVVRGPVQIVLDQVERSGRLAVAVRVDQHERPVAVEQPVGQVQAGDADVGDLDPGRQRTPGEPAGDLDAEPVVGEEDVADARDQDPILGKHPVHGAPPSWATSISSGWK
jgi:hypothetical protein